MSILLTKLLKLTLLCASISLILAAPPTAEIDCTTIACCELTEEELIACAGISEKCPGYSGIGALGPEGECDDCPAGECRVGNSCLCPDEFLASKSGDGFQKLCREHYGKYWPKSIGRENQVCDSEEVVEEEEEELEEEAIPAEEEAPKKGSEPVEEDVETMEELEDTSKKHKSKIGLGVSNVVQYIRKESGNGTNIIGMLSTGVLVISIIAAACCLWTRRRA